jgi:hypothetical protein
MSGSKFWRSAKEAEANGTGAQNGPQQLLSGCWPLASNKLSFCHCKFFSLSLAG